MTAKAYQATEKEQLPNLQTYFGFRKPKHIPNEGYENFEILKMKKFFWFLVNFDAKHPLVVQDPWKVKEWSACLRDPFISMA